MRPRMAVVGLVLLATSAAACSAAPGSPSRPEETPVATGVSSPQETAPPPHSGAPKVEHPLPPTTLGGDPCTDALTPAQIKTGLGRDIVGEDDDEPKLGPGCTWFNDTTFARISVGYSIVGKQGLSGLYQYTKPVATKWEPIEVQGFPAVISMVPKGGHPDYFCGVSVGLADDMSVDVSVFISASKKGKLVPCEAANQAAEMVVTTLRQRAGA